MPRNDRANAEMPSALTCADVRAREWDFVEGALPLPERAAVQAHLDACETCRHSITLCRSAEGALRAGVAQIPPAGDLRADFYARLAAEQRAPRRYGRPVAFAALAAGLLAVALLRPTLPSHPGVPTPADQVRANQTGANQPGANRAVAAPSLRAPHAVIASNTNNTEIDTRNETLALAPHSVPGLSEKQVDRLFRDLDRHYPVLVHRQVAVNDRAARLPARRFRTAAIPLKASPTPDNRTASVNVPTLAAKTADERYALNSPVTHRDRREVAASHFDRSARDYAQDGPTSFNRSLDTASQEANGDKKEVAALGKPGMADTKSIGRTEVTALVAQPPATGISLAVTDDVRGFRSTTKITADVEEQHDGGTTFHISAGDSSN